jgi:hypothetical protein
VVLKKLIMVMVMGGKILLPSKDLIHPKATWVWDNMIAGHIDIVRCVLESCLIFRPRLTK